MVKFEQGSDIPFKQKYRISEGVYVNLADLATYEIWLYTVTSDIKKFSRTGAEAGFNTLRKIDNYEYEAILTDDLTANMRAGEIKMRIVWGQTDANYPDGIYDYKQTICTGAELIERP